MEGQPQPGQEKHGAVRQLVGVLREHGEDRRWVEAPLVAGRPGEEEVRTGRRVVPTGAQRAQGRTGWTGEEQVGWTSGAGYRFAALVPGRICSGQGHQREVGCMAMLSGEQPWVMAAEVPPGVVEARTGWWKHGKRPTRVYTAAVGQPAGAQSKEKPCCEGVQGPWEEEVVVLVLLADRGQLGEGWSNPRGHHRVR